MTTESAGKVLLGMSGGVDSSVACFMLQEQGFEVIGVTLLTNPLSLDHLDDVKAVARQAGIRLLVEDVQPRFSNLIIRDFVEAYASGRTPNPCVLCNPAVKFDALESVADQEGCGYFATGHYAAVRHFADRGRYALTQTDAGQKDQTYFMYRLSQKQLSRLILPLSGYRKEQVRDKARTLGLAAHDGQHLSIKPDSQDNCFIGKEGYAGYIRQHLETHGPARWLQLFAPGPVLNPDGEEIGRHRGLIHYTTGQRKGFDVKTTERLFVLGKQPERNALIVGSYDRVKRTTITVVDPVYSGLARIEPGQRLMARIRNSAAPVPCEVVPQPDGRIEVNFDEAVAAPAAGQSCVFYDRGCIMAGGYISDESVTV